CRGRKYKLHRKYSTMKRRHESTPLPLESSKFKYVPLPSTSCPSHLCLEKRLSFSMLICYLDSLLIQAKISERALELLALPNDGVPRLLLDIGEFKFYINGCGSGLSGETLSENGHHWIGYDISESMLNVGSHMSNGISSKLICRFEAAKVCKVFRFDLYRKSGTYQSDKIPVHGSPLPGGTVRLPARERGNEAMPHLLAGERGDASSSCTGMRHRLGLGLRPGVVDGAISISAVQVGIYDRTRPRKKAKINKNGKGKEWVFKKKEQMRRKGYSVPPDTKYTARKRKAHF
ncbi:hypothetical protein BHE74_00032525, partial [Ensete ventricosum]